MIPSTDAIARRDGRQTAGVLQPSAARRSCVQPACSWSTTHRPAVNCYIKKRGRQLIIGAGALPTTILPTLKWRANTLSMLAEAANLIGDVQVCNAGTGVAHHADPGVLTYFLLSRSLPMPISSSEASNGSAALSPPMISFTGLHDRGVGRR